MKAAAIGVNLDTGKVFCDVFTDEHFDNPADFAWGFIRGIRDDHPEMEFVVVADEEAREKLADTRLRRLGIIDDEEG